MRRFVLLSALVLSAGTPLARAASAQAPATAPSSSDSLFRRARQLVSEGNGVVGRALVDSLLRTAPEGTPAYGNALFWRGALAETAAAAERDYRRVIVEYPLSHYVPDALLSLAELEQARGDRAAAFQHLQRFVREQPPGPARARAGLAAARLAFEQRDQTRGCAMIAEARGSAGSDVELRNQIDYHGARCPAVATAAPAPARTAPAGSGVSTAPAPAGATTTTGTTTTASAPPAASPGARPAVRPSTRGMTLPPPPAAGRPAATAARPRADTGSTPTGSTPAGSAPASAAAPTAPAPAPSAAPTTAPATEPATEPATAASTPATTPAPAAAAAVASPTAPRATARPGRSRFTIQLAAYNTRPDAERLVARLAARGVKARVSGEAKPFRVRLGFYPTHQAAAAEVASLRARGIIGFVTDEVQPAGAATP